MARLNVRLDDETLICPAMPIHASSDDDAIAKAATNAATLPPN